MTTRIATIRVLLCQIACALSAPFLTGVAFAEGMADRMYVFECGESKTTDVSNWSPGVNVGQSREFSDNCYLIKHGDSLFL